MFNSSLQLHWPSDRNLPYMCSIPSSSDKCMLHPSLYTVYISFLFFLLKPSNEGRTQFFLSFVCPDARQLPDVALTGKCTRECDEFGHSDTCWMPIRPSPRQRQRHGSDPPRLSTFAPGDDNNNLRGNDHESDSESAGSAGSSEPGVVVSAEGQRLPLANGDPLGTLGRGDRNRNVGDHNRNLLNRKMTSASYDTFSSAGFGRRQQEEEGGEGQNPPEVIPLTRTGGDYKTTSCLTLSRREVYL